MSFKDYYYKSTDGEHFPDAVLGSNLFYGLDFSCWLKNEEDTLVSIEWTLPDGVTSEDDFLQGTVGNIKLSPTRTGSFVINCVITTEETLNFSTLLQEKSIDTILKVF
jgi:hypothetical protein|tara:strand:- start:1206 stop:1529 length:324 start_codon:yes stop_codon:yes gene_type:complete